MIGKSLLIGGGFLLGAVVAFAAMPRQSDPAADTRDAALLAVKARLVDPDSAKFSNVYLKHPDQFYVVCGLVNARNRMGGYNGNIPFAYTQDRGRVALISSNLSDMTPGDIDLYKKLCG